MSAATDSGKKRIFKVDRVAWLSSSPWKFNSGPWEHAFRDWSRISVQNTRVWLLAAAFPLSPTLIFSLVHDIRTSNMVTFRYVKFVGQGVGFALLAWFYFFRKEAKNERETKNMVVVLQRISWIVLAAASVEIISDADSANDVRQVERVLRGVVIAAFGLATFEWQALWSVFVVTSRTVFRFAIDAGSDSTIVLILFVFNFFVMYYTFASRRSEWRHLVATCSWIPGRNEKGTNSPERTLSKLSNLADLDDRASWYDDYFTKEEWQQVAELVEREGEEMVKRGLDAKTAEGYDWIHTSIKLGAGSYGQVQVVQSRTTGQVGAMKVIPQTEQESATKDSAMVSEAAVLRMLRHPHVVGFIEEVTLESEVHLVMELCDGGSLAQLIGSFGALDLPSARWFTRNIVDGLHYLHRHGISHQDLKPGNCMLARSAPSPSSSSSSSASACSEPLVLLKLADFGFASWKPGDTQRSSWRGTPEYMAPESTERWVSRRRMDLWALGVCVLEMCTGQTLSDLDRSAHGGGSSALKGDIRAQTIRRLKATTTDPRIPAEVADGDARSFIACCLKVSPRERSTALELSAHAFCDMRASEAHASLRAQHPTAQHPTRTAQQPTAQQQQQQQQQQQPSAHSCASVGSAGRAARSVGGLSAIEAVWNKPRFEIQAWHLSRNMLLPRLNRGALFWTNPRTVWQWLQEMEGPFMNQEREDLFQRWMFVNPAVEWALRIAFTSYATFHVLMITKTLASPGGKMEPEMMIWLTVLPSMAVFSWSPREFRVKHKGKLFMVKTCGRGFRILFSTLPTVHMTFYPVFSIYLFFASWIDPSVGEHQLWNVLLVFKVLAMIASSLLQEAKKACAADKTCDVRSTGSWLSRIPPDSLDDAVSSAIVVMFCAGLSAYTALHLRIERRHHFRMVMKLKMVNPDGTEQRPLPRNSAIPDERQRQLQPRHVSRSLSPEGVLSSLGTQSADSSGQAPRAYRRRHG